MAIVSTWAATVKLTIGDELIEGDGIFRVSNDQLVVALGALSGRNWRFALYLNFLLPLGDTHFEGNHSLLHGTLAQQEEEPWQGGNIVSGVLGYQEVDPWRGIFTATIRDLTTDGGDYHAPVIGANVEIAARGVRINPI